jgi:hypothetical protein
MTTIVPYALFVTLLLSVLVALWALTIISTTQLVVLALVWALGSALVAYRTWCRGG